MIKLNIEKIFLYMMLVLIIIFACTACSAESKLEGTWIPTEEMPRDYPEEYITFGDDGTGSADGYTMNWYINEDILYITVTAGVFTQDVNYVYSVSGSTLILDGYTYEKAD